jgi:ATP-dependent Clp protease ATP-binding subunit ClpC
MFERFTNYARHTVVLSQEEARRLHHNYIGTEHLVLGLLGEPEGLAAKVLAGFGMTLDGARRDVTEMIGTGKSETSGHIPFTPQAKKVLEYSLREALALDQSYIGTEHLLLGVLRDPNGTGGQLLSRYGDLLAIRLAVLDQMPVAVAVAGTSKQRRWAQRPASGEGESEGKATTLDATPAVDTALTAAAGLAGHRPVGTHDLLAAALTDADSAVARALAAAGVDLDQVRQALRDADVTGTTDELPEEAGRRQMTIHAGQDKVTIEVTDPVIVRAALAAAEAAGDSGVIGGDQRAAVSLTTVWQALGSSLADIERRARQATADEPGEQPAG